MTTTLERAQAEVDRLTAWPDVADLLHENAFDLLHEVQHWSAKGYRLGRHSLQSFEPGDYYLLMFAPGLPAESLVHLVTNDIQPLSAP